MVSIYAILLLIIDLGKKGKPAGPIDFVGPNLERVSSSAKKVNKNNVTNCMQIPNSG